MFFNYFSDKIRCARQMIHIKCEDLFSLENAKKIIYVYILYIYIVYIYIIYNIYIYIYTMYIYIKKSHLL